MKKITALVLALIMTLSLLPMNVWAEVPVLTSTNNSGQAGVFLFTNLKDTTLSCVENVMQEQGKTTIPCATNAPEYVYLAVGTHEGLKIGDELQGTPIGTWYNERDAFNCNVYRMAVPASTTEYTVARTRSDGTEVYEYFTLVFDFTKDFTGSQACGVNGVFFFSACDFENNQLVAGNNIIYEDGKVVVSCAGQTSKTIFLAASQWEGLNVSTKTLSEQSGTWTFNAPEGFDIVCKVYALTVDKPENGSVAYIVTRSWEDQSGNSNSSSFTLVFDFNREPSNGGGGDQGGNGSRWIEYFTTSGNSKITVEVFPGVDEVIDFPAPGVLENDKLVLTVKSADPDDWLPLLNRGDDAFWIPYTIEAINGPEGFPGKPMIAFADDGEGNLSNAYTNLQNKLSAENSNPFYDYSAFPPARNNSVQYAWSSSSGGGVITIIPQTAKDARAWCWRYNVPGFPDKIDGFAAEVVISEDSGIEEVITVVKETAPAVDASRISLIPHKKLDTVLAFDEYDGDSFSYKEGQDGVLTYTYIGTDTTKTVPEAIYAAAKAENDEDVVLDDSNVLHYSLLKVAAPEGYVAKEVKCSYYTESGGFSNSGREVVLRYHWRGAYEDLTFVLTWKDANPDDATDLSEKVEQVTISMPNTSNPAPWMAYPTFKETVGGETVTNTYQAFPVVADRLSFDSLDGVKGVVAHEYDEETGVLFTTYDNNTIVDTDPILSAKFYLVAPDGAVSFNAMVGRDGTNDPTYNSLNAWKSEFFWGNAIKGNANPVYDGITGSASIEALLKQTYGEDGEIEYYYSADEATRYWLIRWNFEDKAPLYEYIQLDTSSYYCEWEEEVKANGDVDGAVDVPTAIHPDLVGAGINLVSSAPPQNKSGHFFFYLEVVGADEASNALLEEREGDFVIILPYSFIGIDPEKWEEETAKLKTPMIKHFDDDFTLKENQGTLHGTFTERGIEFTVDSFSPFMIVTEDAEDDNTGTGGYPGGYYPSVTPTTPDVSVDIDNSSLNNAAQAVGGAIAGGNADVKPAVGYTKADIAKLQQDGKLEMVIEKTTDCDAADKNLVDAAITKAGGVSAGTKAQYFDITVLLKHEDTGATVGTVSDTKKPISITVDLSSELQKAAKDGKHIYVVRCHEDKTDFLEATLNAAKTKVTFDTAHFSTYAVVALDKAVETVSAEMPAEKPATTTPEVEEPAVTPEPEDTTPVVPDQPPVIDDGAVDEAPADDATESSNAGLWIGVGIVALAAIVVVLGIMVARKKRK